jgi:hypothetical protein
MILFHNNNNYPISKTKKPPKLMRGGKEKATQGENAFVVNNAGIEPALFCL